MKKTVFFKENNKIITEEEYISSQDTCFRSDLKEAAKQLSNTGRVDMPKCNFLGNNSWSLWLEDEKGERHNFILYISALEETNISSGSHLKQTPDIPMVYYVDPNKQARPGENFEYIFAGDFIVKTFNGKTKDKLLNALEESMEQSLKISTDSIEYTGDGVILKALSDNQQVNKYDATVTCIWKSRI